MSQNVHRDRTSVEVSETAARLVGDLGSPLYVYDADRIEEDFRRFRAAFTYAPVDFRSCRLPQVAPGDLLVLKDVGAYGYAMSSHFLNRPRPAEVVLHGGQAHLTTRRETFEDLVATQLDLSRS